MRMQDKNSTARKKNDFERKILNLFCDFILY
jgi:hypothetical protein